MTHSIRDLESIDHETLSGQSEIRSILENNFRLNPLLVDWILTTVAEQNQKIHSLEEEAIAQDYADRSDPYDNPIN